MRYFLQLSYRGTSYVGWQSQPNGVSVQSRIEEVISKMLQANIHIVGCGRTDAKVHARTYYAHFDYHDHLPANLLQRLNGVLPQDIAIHKIILVDNDCHARFDAYERSYQYHIIGSKDPFRQDLAYHHFQFERLNLEQLQEAASQLLPYKAFRPFCKTGSGVEHYQCDLKKCEWERMESELVMTITSNRFLRGMVRLVVGMCLNVALGKLSTAQVLSALENQSMIDRSLSAPPQGLFLTEVKYPFLVGGA